MLADGSNTVWSGDKHLVTVCAGDAFDARAAKGAWQLLAAIAATDAGACSWDFLQVLEFYHLQAAADQGFRV